MYPDTSTHLGDSPSSQDEFHALNEDTQIFSLAALHLAAQREFSRFLLLVLDAIDTHGSPLKIRVYGIVQAWQRGTETQWPRPRRAKAR